MNIIRAISAIMMLDAIRPPFVERRARKRESTAVAEPKSAMTTEVPAESVSYRVIRERDKSRKKCLTSSRTRAVRLWFTEKRWYTAEIMYVHMKKA